MNHWQNLSSEQRIEAWKHFRKTMSGDNYITEVGEFFKYLPTSGRSLDYYDSESWLGPWEILHTGIFCESARALLMFYTLIFFDDHVKMHLINDSGDLYLIVEVSDLILNYRNSTVKKSDVELTIIQSYDKESIKNIF